jgi:hypothetical protein
MPRFVVLRHEMPDSSRATHWDFMIEQNGSLRTWALADEPAADRQTVAEMLPDHRLAYLEYEGPVSGNRGIVARWDAGEYELLVDSPEELRARLCGLRLVGTASLQRESAAAQRWRFCFSA